MEWLIGNKNIKLFAKCFRCLSQVDLLSFNLFTFLCQIGSDVNCEWKGNSLYLKTLNSSHSAFVVLKVNETFFDHITGLIEREGVAVRRKHKGENGISGPLRWQVMLRACTSVFKGITEVELCRMKADESSQRLIFEMLCRKNIKKTYRIIFIDCTVCACFCCLIVS
jgi:hypothetical protein